MVEIKRIDAAHGADARLPNEPFPLWGRMIPALADGVWSYTVERLEQPGEDCFPDEAYDVNDGGIYLGAYEKDRCIGLAVLRRDGFRYLYLDDLKVCRASRGRSVGGLLIEAALQEARAMGLVGVSVIAQDNNLSACLFYLSHGFAIGGFDNRSYRGTKQAEKANIFFYRDCEL